MASKAGPKKCGGKGVLYPKIKRRKQSDPEDRLPPFSGLYEARVKEGNYAEVDLELKIDVEKIREFSPVLNIVSGSIAKSGGHFPWMVEHNALYFRSVEGTVVVNRDVPNAANNEREITCDVRATRADGEVFSGRAEILLRLPQDDGVWNGSLKLSFENETVTFNGVTRKSSFFRHVTIDIDYVDTVVWPTIVLADYYNVPPSLKDRKLDLYAVFEDAGVKLLFDTEDSDKIKDPSPYTPWTKDDMYDVMMANFDRAEDGSETVWCMIAVQPPDERYMGFSFNKNSRHGFGLFTGHKSFDGLLDKSSENFAYANRKFLHYFVHEVGHTLGLKHPFELGKPEASTWMNYAWKYDLLYGPGSFYKTFKYEFTKAEQAVIRHSPSKAFNQAKGPSVYTSNYGVTKSLPSTDTPVDQDDEAETGDYEAAKLSLRLGVSSDDYVTGDMLDLEVRIKNESQITALVERDLDFGSGNMILYVTFPSGSVQKIDSFVTPLTGVGYMKPLILYPTGGEEGSDRYSQLLTVGETGEGPLFSEPGKYLVQATYTGGDFQVNSNQLEINIGQSDTSYESQKDINIASVLGGSAIERSKAAADEWKKIAQLSVEKKRKVVGKLVSVVDSLIRKEVRTTSHSSNKGKKRIRKSVAVKPTAITYKDFIVGTDDILQYYTKQGQKIDNMEYKKLVFARCKVQIKEESGDPVAEYNQLVADLLARGLKYSALKAIADEWEEMKNPGAQVDRTSAAYLQKRVDEILDWYPKRSLHGEKDLSGIGLGTVLNHFSEDHAIATSSISQLLFNKLDETNDVDDVLTYADNLQRGYQVNHNVLQWAVEIFIIHSKLAKKRGILYPLPPDRDSSLDSAAAMTVTLRTGLPEESWMHYWRMDGDLNYHHRHWHSVYVVGRFIGNRIDWFGRWRTERPELARQGELFAYMHCQMLGRYDADRMSWGLPRVQAFNYTNRNPIPFNAGFEFHSNPRNSGVVPRPSVRWPTQNVRRFQQWEQNYNSAVDDGELPAIEVLNRPPQTFDMDFNLAGHVLEASSQTWSRSIGSIHNQGHGVFGTNGIRGGSYMLSTATAMRDPIFYQWHKRIDDLWHSWNDQVVVEVAEDAPSVLIRPSDIIISKNHTLADNFASFSTEFTQSDEMTTYLGPPLKRYEYDNKISHDPFYYHLRFRRTGSGNLNLTFRIFICPSTHINDRKMWIEMDKFVYRLPANQNSAAFIRPDRHSSVIKRLPRDMQNNVEDGQVSVASGFCECGWPYNMLLPRGTQNGQEWLLCVFVSDNNIDQIDVTSSCGSLSFCGASGQRYPDTRPMGFPFTCPITINNRESRIDQMFDLSHVAINSFRIRNNLGAPQPSPFVDFWTAWRQLGQDDGTEESEISSFRTSRVTGAMRVLIDDVAFRDFNNRSGDVSIRFQGRGAGNGIYRIRIANVGVRRGNTPNVVGSTRTITVGGARTFDIPEAGIISDPVRIRTTGDLLVTFLLDSPGAFLGGSGTVSTWVIQNPRGEAEVTASSWSTLERVQTTSSVYCVGAVMVPIP